MGSRSRFRVILDGENRKFFVSKAFDGAIVQVDVCHLEVGCPRHPMFVSRDGKPMVLRGYQDPAGIDLFDRMIPTAMPVGHFHGLGAECETKNLMPEADSEDRHSSHCELFHSSRRIVYRRRISRSVREKHAVRLETEHLFRARFRWHHRHSTVILYEQP